jgi:hypothetical protein
MITNTLGLDANKVKPASLTSVFVCFRSQQSKEEGVKILNGYKWKNRELRTTVNIKNKSNGDRFNYFDDAYIGCEAGQRPSDAEAEENVRGRRRLQDAQVRHPRGDGGGLHQKTKGQNHPLLESALRPTGAFVQPSL